MCLIAQSCLTLGNLTDCNPVLVQGFCQAPLSMGFSRQEYWSGLPFPPPEDLPNPEMKPVSPALQADSFPLSIEEAPRIRVAVSLCYTAETNTALQSNYMPI